MNKSFSFLFKYSVLSSLYSPISEFITSEGTELLPKKTDSPTILEKKERNLRFMELFNKNYIQNLKNNQIKKQKAIYFKNSIKNLNYDLLRGTFNILKKIELPHIKYLPDKNKYKFVNKRVHYRDLSTKNILKILNKKSKLTNGYLSDNCFKKAVKNLRENKPLSEHTLSRINGFLRTLKSSKSKNTLKHFDNLKSLNIAVKSKNTLYSVKIKKAPYLRLFKYTNHHKFKDNIKIINSELNIRIKNSFQLNNLTNSNVGKLGTE